MLLTLNSMNDKEASVNLASRDSFYIRTNNVLTRIRLTEIDWIQADGNYCEIHVQDKKYAARTSLKRLADMLPQDQFIQIHKSYIIRLDRIEKVDTNEHMISVNGISLPLGRTYKDKLMNRLNII